MQYRIRYEKRTLREDVPKIPVANREQIGRAIRERLAVAPVELGEPLTGKFVGLRRLRVGDWRIIYKVEPGVVSIHAIRIRRDAYKGWKPSLNPEF